MISLILDQEYAEYNTSSTISPFDFASRSFASQGNSVPDPLVPEENLIVTYDYYQPRKDRIFLDKAGDFIYVQGVPSDNPKEPQNVGDAIEVAKIELPAYLRSVDQVKMIRTKHKRFTMALILEDLKKDLKVLNITQDFHFLKLILQTYKSLMQMD